MDALDVLSHDHRAISDLFDSYAQARELMEKEEVALELVQELSAHAALEEMVFFRMTRDRGPVLRHHIDTGLETHLEIARTLVQLEGLLTKVPQGGHEETLDGVVAELVERVRSHVVHDNERTFPAIRRVLTVGELEAMGRSMVDARPSAPRHPRAVGSRSVTQLGDGRDVAA